MLFYIIDGTTSDYFWCCTKLLQLQSENMATSLYSQSMMPSRSSRSDRNDEHHQATTSPVELVAASELRVGKFCMVEGFPCRIRDIKRSSPGKHGHPKLRIVGTGVLDDKKRNTIHKTHDAVQVPMVERFPDVPCVTMANGSFEVDPKHELFRKFPVLYCSETNGGDIDLSSAEGQKKTLSVIVTCGRYRVGAIENDSSELEANSEDCKEATVAEPTVLSKKELRKLKKQQKKEAVMVASDLVALPVEN